MTPRHLESTALSASQCEKIVVEAHEGEAQLSSADQVQPRLRVLLGLSTCSGAPPVRNGVRRKVSERVGQRKPKRDQVGFDQGHRIRARNGL